MLASSGQEAHWQGGKNTVVAEPHALLAVLLGSGWRGVHVCSTNGGLSSGAVFIKSMGVRRWGGRVQHVLCQHYGLNGGVSVLATVTDLLPGSTR